MATESELSRDADAALEAVDARMIEAEKDARFAELVREAVNRRDDGRLLQWADAGRLILSAHWQVYNVSIYGTPCTASAKAEGK